MKPRTVPLAPIRLRAELASADTKKRRAQATIYTGAEMERFDFLEGHYTLRLAMDGADFSRFNAGAPVTKNHSTNLDDVVGVTERAWIADGAAHATFRLSDREELASLWDDMKGGVINRVSMDVALVELEDVTKRRGGKRALLATQWQPIGLAIVPAGADPGAQMMTLSADTQTRPCRFKGGHVMRKFKKCPSCSAKLNYEPDTELTECEECGVDLAEAEKARDELARVGRIHQLAEHFKLGEVWAQKHVKAGTSKDDAYTDAARERAERQPQISGLNSSAHLDYESPAYRASMMAEGLAARAMGKEPSERGRAYYRTSLVELAYECIQHGAVEHRMLDPRYHATRIVDVALTHTTSDYQIILGNAVNRMLQPEYEQAPATYRSICAKREFRDFRPHSFVRLGDFPDLKQTGEAGEIQHGTISESGETVTGANYARIYSISRRALVNDDVGAFADLVMKAARRVVNFEDGLFFAVLTSNSGNGPTMSDNVALFNAAHGNTGTGTIDVTNVGAGVALMMKQTGLDGVKLNIEPAILLVSPDRLAVGRQFVAQNLRPTQPSEVNPFVNLTALADANLTTAAPWFLFAAGANSSFVYGYVDGAQGPRIDTRAGWEIEGLQVRCSLDFAVGAIDWRGAYKSSGS